MNLVLKIQRSEHYPHIKILFLLSYIIETRPLECRPMVGSLPSKHKFWGLIPGEEKEGRRKEGEKEEMNK